MVAARPCSKVYCGAQPVRLRSLTPTRDVNYVKDTANGFMTIADCDAAIGQELNIALSLIHIW